eukprot:2115591-Amphidinium_carterae.2
MLLKPDSIAVLISFRATSGRQTSPSDRRISKPHSCQRKALEAAIPSSTQVLDPHCAAIKHNSS